MSLAMKVRHDREIDNWIKERHYLKSVPAGAKLRLEFLDRSGNRIGGMMWGHPTARNLDQHKLLELTRMYFVDDTEHCVESKALAMARKYIRKHFPQVNGLIAYTSAAEGHKGTVYLADGWFKIGETKISGEAWESRKGRVNRDVSYKTKFGRTP